MGASAFIFDLDGVIVDTAKYHYLAWKKLANELGFEFTKEQNELFKGVSRKRCLEILLDIGGITATQEQFDRWMVEKNEDYLEYIEKMDASEILPDVPKVIGFLKDRNIPIALGSASKNARPILEKVKLLPSFDAIVDGNDVSKAKPDPEVFLIAARKLNVAPENCVVFEDAVAGIQAANNADMISIGIGDAQILSEADYNFNDFTEMSLAFLESLTSVQA
ncbi:MULTISPECIES: beta-phosphoglucomutase [Zobellia]|uniref:Beta-phosphoglucomutase n=1 Tax=Zobellia galactanivorans (strain DSM 12802 / CCUG 47099 / CIP 106680 / NCIMB 13871 / Dsij) TaxID=63186 RepID=G0LAH0_ZOBGA|nr:MULTISPECIES: beta-phosphoglucomutase [Zobellia]MBU3028214.1 beta-phosphoglucomutase [Zobellia galactanivorans]OWW26365.1 beta-phosphoglucomutase [Zobellia sp. OII3]CAZ95306.1 Beta-phosphoglucomutase [Zobellia galactanivorans]